MIPIDSQVVLLKKGDYLITLPGDMLATYRLGKNNVVYTAILHEVIGPPLDNEVRAFVQKAIEENKVLSHD